MRPKLFSPVRLSNYRRLQCLFHVYTMSCKTQCVRVTGCLHLSSAHGMRGAVGYCIIPLHGSCVCSNLTASWCSVQPFLFCFFCTPASGSRISFCSLQLLLDQCFAPFFVCSFISCQCPASFFLSFLKLYVIYMFFCTCFLLYLMKNVL